MVIPTGIKLALCISLCFLLRSKAVEVTTPNGKIIGFDSVKTRNGRQIFSFTAIPYAKAPVGPLRFKEPQPLEPWKDPIDATKNASVCPQVLIFDASPVKVISGKEDCLYLNIYSPKVDAKARLPVMYWIHGGGFTQGSGDRGLYGPEFLLDKDIVLVTINYRLGVLGFATTGDDVIPGNLGLKDQSFGLKWVHDNIESFGGDPNSVTVFGESAGGASAHLSILTPLNKGLVHRSISMSGTALCPWAITPLQVMKDRTKAVATLSGCPVEPSDEFLQCLQEVPADDLVHSDRKFQTWIVSPAVIFGPVIEPETAKGAFITSDPSQIESKIPWITGLSSGEGGLFVSLLGASGGKYETELQEHPQHVLPKILMLRMSFAKNDVPAVSERIQKFYFEDRPIDKDASEELIDLMTDSWFLSGAIDGVSRHSGDAWLYYYDYTQSVSYTQIFGNGDIKSVCHSDILLNLFRIPSLFPLRTETDKDIKESEKVLDIWTNFAKYGKPSENSTLKWEPAGKGPDASKRYLYIGKEVVQKENLLPERVGFWNSVNDIGLRKKSVNLKNA